MELSSRLLRSAGRLLASIVVVGLLCTEAGTQTTVAAEYHVIRCGPKSAATIGSILERILPPDESRHVVVDAKDNVLLIRGSQEDIRVVRELLDTVEAPSQRNQQQKIHSVKAFLPLSSDAQTVERRVVQLFGSRLQRIGREPTSTYRLIMSQTSFLDFEFDLRRQGVNVTSSDQAISQFRRLVQALDSIGKLPGQRVGVVSIQRTDRTQLGRTVEAFSGRASPSQGDSSSRRRTQNSQIALTAHSQEDDTPAAEEPRRSQLPGQADQELRELGVNVDVEMLEDLDVIILRGRDRDVARLTRIIQELERLSEETRPEIRIYHLRHSNNEALAEVIEQVSEDLVGGRQGRVSVTPLVQPNSLLLIGWGEAVRSMLTLIAKLDMPVPPEAQLTVLRLRYASATDLTQRITEFFNNREGMGARVQATADPRSNSLIVFASPRDIGEVRRLVNSLDTPTSSVRNKARVFKIKNALATDIATTLQQAIQSANTDNDAPSAVLELMTIAPQGGQIVRSGMLSGVSVTPNARNNTVVVTGPAESMDLIAGLIEELDAPGASAQIKVFRIINGSAGSLVQLLRSLLPSDTGDSSGSQLPSAEGETSLAPLRFSVDIRTNSIIATGSPGDLEIIHALLLRLDESGDSERQNTVYQLKNAPAIDVAASVNEFLRSERVVQEAAPGAPSPFEQIEREVIVVPEPIRNNLIISATPRYYDDILELIEDLDSQPPQVMIQVLIAEVKLGEADEFGVELGLQDSVLFDRSLLGDIFTTVNTLQQSTPAGIITSTEEFIRAATNTPGFNFNNVPLGNSGSRDALAGSDTVGGQGLSSFALGRVNNELGFGGLVLSASSDSVSLLIRALQETNRIQILSRPQIRTLDNQSAYIQVGQRVPRIIGSTINQIGQQNTVALENVGLILGVTPRISPEGTVVMEIDAEKSALGPESEGIPISVSVDGTVIRSPRIDITTAQATVSAASGETIVLGGLITKSTQEFSRRVPYLSDIPLLGNLFRYDGYRDRRSELLIVLTPRVIRSADDGELIKQTELARMSWCAAHVYDLYGDIGYSIGGIPTNDNDVPIIFPDENPRGMPTGPIENAPPVPVPLDSTRPSQGAVVPGTIDHDVQPATATNDMQKTRRIVENATYYDENRELLPLANQSYDAPRLRRLPDPDP